MQYDTRSASSASSTSSTSSRPRTTKPRVIIHGGAGHITRSNLPPALWKAHKQSLTSIFQSTESLFDKDPYTSALDAATHAVALLERDPLFNAAHGAVFTRTGTIELEASVMVSSSPSASGQEYRKRGAAVSLVKHVKSPITLAAQVLKRGDDQDAGGAQGHVHLSGAAVEQLAKTWGLEMVEEDYFWTRKRWEEHKRGLEREKQQLVTGTGREKFELCSQDAMLLQAEGEHQRPDGKPWSPSDPSWDGYSYLPQGTVGCVVLDAFGTVAIATSTGGITNKLPGRIGDTPTFGAGYWAEEWSAPRKTTANQPRTIEAAIQTVMIPNPWSWLSECFPFVPSATRSDQQDPPTHPVSGTESHSVALGGTGNGDSFLRVAACRSAAARARFSASPPVSLAKAVSWMAGTGGQLQQSAGNRWGKTGEGEGGIIGIDCIDGNSTIVFDFNCGGLFRCYSDHHGKVHCDVFKDPY